MEKFTCIAIYREGVGGGPGNGSTYDRLFGDVDMSPHRPLRPDEKTPKNLVQFVIYDSKKDIRLVPVCLFGK